MPDLRWVRACYGVSDYYARLYGELLFTLSASEVQVADVRHEEFDLLDTEALTSFVKRHKINAVNLSYVLYELRPESRLNIVETLVRALYPPGVVIVTEPREELAGQGCTVTLFDQLCDSPQLVCAVSDGHFMGAVTPLMDYRAFVSRYPVYFTS